ncbi:MAG: serine/threonine protein kinase [Myxococcales bacterium]|nr:serine/threonine protein kinase [Myxococcales bacterium]
MFPQDAVGDRLGRYEVLTKLATGGMAEIYLGRMHGAAGFEKLCVLKRILPSVAADKKLVAMFLDEARLSATLHHTNIAEVFDLGTDGDTYFYAMEYIHGQDARAIRLKCAEAKAPIPLDVSLAIIHGVASALDYAHTRSGPDGPLGIVHRDVSPGNVLVSYDGAVKLCDFGIARATTRASDTKTGTLKGKIPYMSPEQLQGQRLDHRSDLFALGIMLYELTVGCRPFRGPTEFAIMERIVNHAPKPPSLVVPGYPGELERIVLKLLANQPEHRYQHAGELISDLDADLERLAISPSPLLLGKYMRALFPDELAAWERAMRRGTTLAQHLTDTGPFPIVRRAQTDPAAYETVMMRAEARAPRAETELDPAPAGRGERMSDAAAAAALAAFGSEGGTLQGITPFPELRKPAEPTADPRPALADEIDPTLGGLARFEALAAQARTAHVAGDLGGAVVAAEAALTLDDEERVAPMSARLDLAPVFTAYLGDLSRQPALARPLEDITSLPIAPESAFLLSRIDGMMSLEDLLDICGMPRESAMRQLCQLYLLGLLV